MSMTYELCLKMLESPRYTNEELNYSFNVMHFVGKSLSEMEYTELMLKLNPPIEEVVEEIPTEETI